MVVAFRPKAHEAGQASIALAVTLQLDLWLRQKDAIDEWAMAGDGSRDGIVDGLWRWQWDLTWDRIDKDWILRKPTSKSNGNEVAEHDLKPYPDVIERLAKILQERRIEPVIIDEGSGKPYHANHFSRPFRKIATASGWPKEVEYERLRELRIKSPQGWCRYCRRDEARNSQAARHDHDLQPWCRPPVGRTQRCRM